MTGRRFRTDDPTTTITAAGLPDAMLLLELWEHPELRQHYQRLALGQFAERAARAVASVPEVDLPEPVGVEEITGALARARRAADDYLKPLEKAVRQALARAAREAAAAYLEHVTDQLTAAGDEAPADPGWSPPSADQLVPAEILREQLHSATDPIRKKAVEQWIGAFGRDMPGISFKLKSPFFGAVLEGSAQHIADVTETTRRELIALLARAYADGLSVIATSELIRSAMTSDASTRARTIARTELQRIANGSAVAGVRIVSGATGERFLKRWLVGPGAEHPRHELVPDLDGQTRGLDEPFDVNGYPADHPGDGDLPPEESIACRCAVTFEASEEAER